MSQISDVGVNFKMTGGNAFEQQIKSIETSFKHLSTSLGNNQIKGHLDKMEGHFRGMHRGIKAQLRLTETAIAGFLGGKVVSGLKNWVLGGTGADIDKQKDYLRIHGASTEGLNNLSKSLDQLADKRPTDKLSGWSIGENIMSMLGGLDDPALVKRATDATSNLAYILGAQGDLNAAMDLSTPFVAGFGAKLDPTGKLDLLDRFNSGVKYLTDTTQLRGPDIQNILPQVIGPYLGAGLSPEQMFAHMGILDFLRGQSGEVLKNLFGKEGKTLGGIGAELDKQSYLADLQRDPAFKAREAQRSMDRYGERMKPSIRSEADLPEGLRQELNREVAKRKLEYEAEGGRLLAQGKHQEYSQLMLGALHRLKELQAITGKSVNAIISEYFGETAIKGIYPLLESIASGKDKQMVQEMQARAANSKGMTGELNSKFQSLGAKGKTFEDAVGGLTADIRRTLEPGVIEVLTGWQESIQYARKQIQDLKTQSQISQNIKDVISGTRGGLMETLYGPGASNAMQTLDDAIKNFATSIGQGGWKETGEKIGRAAGEFVLVLGQLKEIIGSVHSALSTLGLIKPLAIAAVTPGPLPLKAAIGIGVGAYDGISKMGFQQGGPLDERGLLYPTPLEPKPAPELTVPAHRSGGMIAPPASSDGMITSHRQNEVTFSPKNNIEVQVTLDGDEIAQRTTARVKERIEADQGRNRGNALDQPLMAN